MPSPNSKATSRLQLPVIAGANARGEPVVEEIEAELVSRDPPEVRLVKSPLLARDYAAGDKLRIVNPETAEYELILRSGNLCVRVYRKQNIEEVADSLTPVLEKLGGMLDVQTDRALVYTIHFSIGFKTIEDALNQAVGEFPDSVWYYGNVYDPEDGVTPLGWWNDL
ncbi:MAG: DUF4265 domain-containing protein [Pseudohongiellaceae bacterium]